MGIDATMERSFGKLGKRDSKGARHGRVVKVVGLSFVSVEEGHRTDPGGDNDRLGISRCCEFVAVVELLSEDSMEASNTALVRSLMDCIQTSSFSVAGGDTTTFRSNDGVDDDEVVS